MKRELKAMAWGYGVTAPLAIASLYIEASPVMILILFLLGFLITLVQLSPKSLD